MKPIRTFTLDIRKVYDEAVNMMQQMVKGYDKNTIVQAADSLQVVYNNVKIEA